MNYSELNEEIIHKLHVYLLSSKYEQKGDTIIIITNTGNNGDRKCALN